MLHGEDGHWWNHHAGVVNGTDREDTDGINHGSDSIDKWIDPTCTFIMIDPTYIIPSAAAASIYTHHHGDVIASRCHGHDCHFLKLWGVWMGAHQDNVWSWLRIHDTMGETDGCPSWHSDDASTWINGSRSYKWRPKRMRYRLWIMEIRRMMVWIGSIQDTNNDGCSCVVAAENECRWGWIVIDWS